jgi:phosphoribosyl 1,2-cyclic phosphodiesterase
VIPSHPQQSLFDFWGEERPSGAPADVAPARPRPARPQMRIGVLGSGSGGNAVVVESGGHRILVDAGFSARELVRRMAALAVDPRGVAAVVLTHEHIDHCRGADRFSRRFHLPLFATAGTLDGVALGQEAAARAETLRSGVPREVGGFQVEPFTLPHDAREPVGLVIEDASGCRVGLVADCGSRSQLAWARLRDLDVLILETNHDLEMLRSGPYPWPLKQRVAGRHGHLSNREAAEGLPELIGDRLQWVVLYHLSKINNLPALAAAAVGEVLDRERCGACLAVSEQDRPLGWLEVR